MQQFPHITDQSQTNLGRDFSGVAGKGVYISFQWDNITLSSSDPEKNGKRQRRLRLTKQPIGDPNTAATSYITEAEAKELFPAEWDYFTKHGDMPVSGTALSELPGISVSQIQILQLSGLRSIEDLVSVPMEVINQIGHEGRYVRSVAEEWIAKSEENQELQDVAAMRTSFESALASEKAGRERAEAEMQAMKAQLDALQKMVGGGGQMTSVQPGMNSPMGDDAQRVSSTDPLVDDTPNPLAEGTGLIEDDPLAIQD